MNQTQARSAAERLLDQAIELTFPASDPIAVDHAYGSARKRLRGRSNAPSGSRGRRAAKPTRRRRA